MQSADAERETKEGVTAGAAGEATLSTSEVSPKVLVDIVITLCSGSNLTVDDKQKIAIDAILPCHHPAIGELLNPTKGIILSAPKCYVSISWEF